MKAFVVTRVGGTRRAAEGDQMDVPAPRAAGD
jgi:hypothetical protein